MNINLKCAVAIISLTAAFAGPAAAASAPGVSNVNFNDTGVELNGNDRVAPLSDYFKNAGEEVNGLLSITGKDGLEKRDEVSYL